MVSLWHFGSTIKDKALLSLVVATATDSKAIVVDLLDSFVAAKHS